MSKCDLKAGDAKTLNIHTVSCDSRATKKNAESQRSLGLGFQYRGSAQLERPLTGRVGA